MIVSGKTKREREEGRYIKIISAQKRYEKCNQKVEQYQSYPENHLWSHHWYYPWTGNSQSNCNCPFGGSVCWGIKSNRSASGILPCNEFSGTYGRRTENKHGLYRYALYAWERNVRTCICSRM